MSNYGGGSKHDKKDGLLKKQEQEKLQIILNDLLKEEENKYCGDCEAKGPRWASWNLGVFLCIRCAGIHRNLGVHVSKVKSINLDSWTPEQVQSLRVFGNSVAKAVYEAHLPDHFRRPQTDGTLETFIRAKYEQKRYAMKDWLPPVVDVRPLLAELEGMCVSGRKKPLSSSHSGLDKAPHSASVLSDSKKRTTDKSKGHHASAGGHSATANVKKVPSASSKGQKASPKPATATEDLLGLDWPTSANHAGPVVQSDSAPGSAAPTAAVDEAASDFGEFAVAAPTTTTTSDAQSSTSLNGEGVGGGTSGADLLDAFGGVTTSNEHLLLDAMAKMANEKKSKHDILALYGSGGGGGGGILATSAAPAGNIFPTSAGLVSVALPQQINVTPSLVATAPLFFSSSPNLVIGPTTFAPTPSSLHQQPPPPQLALNQPLFNAPVISGSGVVATPFCQIPPYAAAFAAFNPFNQASGAFAAPHLGGGPVNPGGVQPSQQQSQQVSNNAHLKAVQDQLAAIQIQKTTVTTSQQKMQQASAAAASPLNTLTTTSSPSSNPTLSTDLWQ